MPSEISEWTTNLTNRPRAIIAWPLYNNSYYNPTTYTTTTLQYSINGIFQETTLYINIANTLYTFLILLLLLLDN